MRDKPSGITIPAHVGERIGRMLWRLGFGLHRVRFADHRSPWCGIDFHVYFFAWEWHMCVIRWPPSNRYRPAGPIYSLQQQILDAHGDRWAAREAEQLAQEEEAREHQELLWKIVDEGIKQQPTEKEENI